MYAQALESNPRMAAGVNQASDAISKMVFDVSTFAQQAMGQQQPEEEVGAPQPASPDASSRLPEFAAAEPVKPEPPAKSI